MNTGEFNPSKYIPLKMDNLRSGMRIDYSIYHKNGDDYLLLCKDVELSTELIARFYRVTSPNFVIYVPNEHYNEIVNYKPPRIAIATGVYSGYTEVKSETSNLLDAISETGTVSKAVSDSISTAIHEQIDEVDVSDIIDSINRSRDIDEYLQTHSVNVSILNGLIGKWLNYDSATINTLIEIGLLHDAGKLRIPGEILNKPGKLTAAEFELVKKHPAFSRVILIDSGVRSQEMLLGVAQHHERSNGQGYPDGLTMGDISEFASITAVSDVYDAMVAKRTYKDAHSPFQILAEFSDGRYSELDIKLVNVFLEAMTTELIGKGVLLSNGDVGKVVYVNPSNFEYPYVDVRGKRMATNADFYCVALTEDFG